MAKLKVFEDKETDKWTDQTPEYPIITFQHYGGPYKEASQTVQDIPCLYMTCYNALNQTCQNDNIVRRQQPYVNCNNKKYESPTSSGKEAVAQVKVFEK